MFAWTLHRPEDVLLAAQWERERGRLSSEVPIAGPREGAAWADDSTTRHPDGVRRPAETAIAGTLPFSGQEKECYRAIQCHPPELFEVTRRRNRPLWVE